MNKFMKKYWWAFLLVVFAVISLACYDSIAAEEAAAAAAQPRQETVQAQTQIGTVCGANFAVILHEGDNFNCAKIDIVIGNNKPVTIEEGKTTNIGEYKIAYFTDGRVMITCP